MHKGFLNLLVRLKYILFLHILWTSIVFGAFLDTKYPSYSYVFDEFDVDESYLYDDAFITFVMKNEKKLKSFYKRSLRRGKEILPMMQGQLIDDGVSDLFIYLSMVESGFSSSIVSPKKAVGLWQFMPATARHYNLTVCSNYDERCDTVSATAAAIRYLNKLHRQFGKWYLAALAYNCGEGCVEKAIKRAGTDELSILTDASLKYLPPETRQYMKKILLVAMIGENETLGYGTKSQNTLENTTIQVEVSGGTSLHKIAKLLKMNEKKLLNLNKSLKNGAVPKDISQYKITIPMGKLYAFYLRYEEPIATSKKEKVPKSHMVLHNIQLGETLASISKQYNADIDEIKWANHLKDDFLTLDDMLVIPVTQNIFNTLSK